MEKENKIWLNILKIIACISVVINHACIIKVGNSNIEILFYCLQFALSKIAVPIFIMITATLLINKKIDFKYVIKKITKILIPLTFLSILTYIIRNETFDFVDFISCFFKAEIVHPYWYLYMLIGLYLMIPILNKMISNLNKRDLKYLLLVSLILPSSICLIEKIMKFDLNYSFTISFFTIIISYYISGVYISKIELNKKNKNKALLGFIIPIIFFIIYMFLENTINNKMLSALDDYKLITTVLPSLSMFYLIRYYFEDKTISEKTKKIINKISGLTFGIYLFHTIYMYKLYESSFIQTIYNINSILGAFTFETTIIIIGLFITYILKKIPIIKKYL